MSLRLVEVTACGSIVILGTEHLSGIMILPTVTCSLADLPWLPCLMEGLIHPELQVQAGFPWPLRFTGHSILDSKHLQEKSQLVTG